MDIEQFIAFCVLKGADIDRKTTNVISSNEPNVKRQIYQINVTLPRVSATMFYDSTDLDVLLKGSYRKAQDKFGTKIKNPATFEEIQEALL